MAAPRRSADAETQSRQLVAGANAGDAAALASLLEAHLPGLRGFIRLRMGKELRAREDSADLVQSACRQALQALGSFRYEGEAAFRDWLYTTAQNKLIDRLRHHRAQRRDLAREVPLRVEPSRSGEEQDLLACYATLLTPSRDAAARELVRRYEEAFDRLPQHYREVILLARVVGLAHAEIARRMNRSEGAVRNLLYRGLAQLSWWLEQP